MQFGEIKAQFGKNRKCKVGKVVHFKCKFGITSIFGGNLQAESSKMLIPRWRKQRMHTKDKQKVLADRINTLCKQNGISYYALSYKSTVPLTTLLHIVDGSTKNPGIFTITKICEGLGITLKEFFDTDAFRDGFCEGIED